MATGRNDYDLPVVPGTGGIIVGVVGGKVSIPGNSSASAQPATGVEWLITAIGVERGLEPYFEGGIGITDGTNATNLLVNVSGAGVGNPANVRLYVNDTYYLHFSNTNASGTNGLFTGVQL